MIQLVYNNFASRIECMDMKLAEFVEFFEDLANEADRVRTEMNKRGQ